MTGLGALYGGFDMDQGTDGFMTGFAFPEILLAMNNAAQAGDLDKAHKIYHKYVQVPVTTVTSTSYMSRAGVDG